jgi:hypothetical protein
MEITEEFRLAVDRHEGAIRELSLLLEHYRDDAELPRQTGPEAELDAAAERYEETSVEVTGLIIPYLVVNPPGDADQAGGDVPVSQDDDAVTRMSALLEIDATVVRYTAVITALRDPEGAGYGLRTEPLTQVELEDLGVDGLAEMCEPAFAELRQANSAAAPPPASPGETSRARPSKFEVKPYFDVILNRAGTDIAGTIASGLAWEKSIAHGLLHTIRDFANWLPGSLRHALTPLRRLLIRGWRQALSKVSLLVGPHASDLGEFIVSIVQILAPDAEGWGGGKVLGMALQSREPQVRAQKLVDDNRDRVWEAKEACEKVDAHHKKMRKLVRLLNAALPGLQLIPVHGLQLQVIATATLLIYHVSLAHDHLDSPVLQKLRLPKNIGLLTEIQTAVA